MDAFVADTELCSPLAKQAYEQVMGRQPKDGPYMISWEKVW